MGVMDKLKVFVVQEPVVAASCLIAGFAAKLDDVDIDESEEQGYSPSHQPHTKLLGLFLPAVVRPILDSFETAEQVPQPALRDVVAGVTGKARE